MTQPANNKPPLQEVVLDRIERSWGLVRRFTRNLVADFLANGCQKSAAALTYMTLFAIVPLMTVMYSMFSVIPAFSDLGGKLEELIFSNFVPETGHEIQAYLSSFSDQARNLTWVGTGMLVITAYVMLTNIEKTFNQIWGVDKPRRGLFSFLLYWAVLTLGPLLLGVGLVMNTYLLSLQLVVNEYDTLGIIEFIYRFLPWLTTAAAFTLLFAAVPNCRVPFKYAAVGGGVTALVFELLKNVFSAIVANSSFQLVYGAFAAVPLFLLWINLVWTVILSGSILVRTLAEKQYFISEGKITDMVAALRCLNLFLTRSRRGKKVSDGDCYRLGLGVVHWQFLRAQFVRHGWIVVTSGGYYVLSRDLRTLTLLDLARVVKLTVDDLDAIIARPPSEAWFQRYLSARSKVRESIEEHFQTPLEALLEGVPGDADHDAAGDDAEEYEQDTPDEALSQTKRS